MMVEAGAKEVSEEDMLQRHPLTRTRRSRSWSPSIEGIVAEIGKPKREFPLVTARTRT